MNPCKNCCDPSEMDAYLTGNLAAEQQLVFEQRLSTCESCRQKLEEQAADQEVWEKARLLLNPEQEFALTSTSDKTAADTKDRSAKLVLEALAPTDDPEMLGRLGEYEISGVVGVGGMGAVLRGFDKSLRRIVAIKVMAPHLADNGPARARFQREARAAAAITHDNVIDIHSVAEANGLPYIVMPFARGPSLQSRIDRNGPLTPLEVVRIGKQIASGLAAAHEQGLVHRDIKPANILLNEGVERLWITDFGVAHAMDDASMTKTGVIAGTPQYMSPEQARGESVDHASDLFSLGSVLYTACTGRPPFRSEAAYGILRRITDTEPRPIREINPDIPQWLCDTIGRLMAKQVSERSSSAGEVAELFENYLVYLQNPAEVREPYTSMPQVRGRDFETRTLVEQPAETGGPKTARTRRYSLAVACCLVLFAALGAAGWQATSPVDISGTWSGEDWSRVTLSSVEEAEGWYNGTFADGQGRTGAIDLKWSRLKQRYTGRWKSGGEQVGSITLRGITGLQLRGAISVDAEASIRKDQARLRDFTWQRADGKRSSTLSKALSAEVPNGARPVYAPANGRVARVSHEAQGSKTVKEGEIIAVIEQMLDPEELETRLEAARMAIVEVEAERVKSKGALEIASNNLKLEERRLTLLKDSENQLADASAREVDSATGRLEAKKKEHESTNNKVDLAQEALERAELLFKTGVASEDKLFEARATLQESKAKLAQAQSQIVESENALESKKQLLQAGRVRSQIELEAAKASVANAEAILSTAESELQLSERKLANAQKRLLNIENRRTRSIVEVVASKDGRIVDFKAFTGSVVKQGDVLCYILPKVVKNTQETTSAESRETPLEPSIPLGGPNRSSIHLINSLPPLACDSCRRLATTLQTASRFAQRYREAQDQLDRLKDAAPKSGKGKKQLVQLQDQRNQVKQEVSEIVENLVSRRKEFQYLHDIESQLADNLKQRFNAGEVSQFDYLTAQLSFHQTEQELRLMDQLVAFYSDVANISASNEREQIIAVLKRENEAVNASISTQQKISDALKFAFESGTIPVSRNIESQKALAQLQRQRKDLKQLLERYSELSDNDIKSAQ